MGVISGYQVGVVSGYGNCEVYTLNDDQWSCVFKALLYTLFSIFISATSQLITNLTSHFIFSKNIFVYYYYYYEHCNVPKNVLALCGQRDPRNVKEDLIG